MMRRLDISKANIICPIRVSALWKISLKLNRYGNSIRSLKAKSVRFTYEIC